MVQSPEKYIIYKLTSPEKRSYIGATKMDLKERIRLHTQRAPSKPNHPFYASVLKYGMDAFSQEIIDACYSKTEANRLEIFHIAEHGLDNLYNISPGGENDMLVAPKVFWEYINSHPEEKSEYIQKLCDAQNARDKIKHSTQSKNALQWMKDNPKLAYKNAMRSLRLAKKANITTGKKQLERDRVANIPLKERLLKKFKGVHLANSRAVTKVWQERSEAEIAEIASKISETQKSKFRSDPELKKNNAKQLSTSRDCIDRVKQGKAASAGLKKYWEDLKSDPVKYAAYKQNMRDKEKARREAKKSSTELA